MLLNEDEVMFGAEVCNSFPVSEECWGTRRGGSAVDPAAPVLEPGLCHAVELQERSALTPGDVTVRDRCTSGTHQAIMQTYNFCRLLFKI